MAAMTTPGSRLTRAAGAVAAAIGLTALVGRLLGVEYLALLFPNYPVVKANAALMVALAGISLVIPTRSTWRFLPALALAAIAGVTLFEWVTGMDAHIDQLLATDTSHTIAPGRPTPEIAVAMLVFGAARILAGNRRTSVVLSTLLAATFTAIVIAVELGYLYGAHELISREATTGVSVPTAIALVFLTCGLVASTAHHPPVAWLRDDGTVGRLARRLLPATLFTAPVLGWLAQLGERHGLYSAETRLVLFASTMAIVLTATTIAVLAIVARSEMSRERLANELTATFEHLPASMTLRDTRGVFLRVNRTWVEHTNFDTETIIGKSMEDVYPAEILPWAKAEVDEVLDLGTSTHSEYSTDLGNGPRTFDVTRYPVFDDDGAAIGVGTFTLDITDRKRAEEAAAAATARIQAYLNAAPDATVVVDGQGIVRYANPQVTALLGYGRAELVGQSVDVLVPDRTRGGHAHLRAGFVANPVQRAMGGRTLTVRHKDGHEIPVTISLGPTETDEGTWTLAAIRDVTAQRAAEQALAAAEERYRTDLDLAGIVQRQLLLAPTPAIAGYDVASAFLPASQVTGDFYDLWMPDDELRIVVADVMGKGVGAAIIGSAFRAILHAALTFERPAAAMARAAADLESDLAHTSRFTTCFAARLDPPTGNLGWVDAGHGLAVVLRADGSHDWLRGDDLPVGAMPGSTWTESTSTLEPGDLLLVASDGLLDQFDDVDGIVDLVQSQKYANARALLDAIAWGCTVRDDDITLVALRRTVDA